MANDIDHVANLYRRPGFMLRRAHQIAVSVFLDATAELGVTTTQFGVLVLLGQHHGLDQASVARLLGLDRSTTALVVRKLEERGLLTRAPDVADRRRHCLSITGAGRVMVDCLSGPAEAARLALLSPLSLAEQDMLLGLLAKLTDAFNTRSRVKLLTDDAAD
jgi:DNA-binding MarR family transcriptional regulator